MNQVLYRKLLTDTLFENQARYRVPVLNFTVTSNHIHLLVVSPPDREAIPERQFLVSETQAIDRYKNRLIFGC